MLPSTFLNLPHKEKAFIMASIDIKIKDDKEKEKQIKKGKRARKR